MSLSTPFDRPDLSLERSLLSQGYMHVAGVDEVGRGALAGPVVAAAVIMDPQDDSLVGQVNDSKKLTPAKREKLYDLISERAISVGLAFVDHSTIDRINILNASLLAMKIAVEKLTPLPQLCLVDGHQKFLSDVPQRTVIKGDQKVFTIGAASIIAKVARDRWMVDQEKIWPEYGFAQNKGYGTSLHRKAIDKHGQSTIHRRSFVLKEKNDVA
ncbi:MAG: ribonuclease HII [Bdellovibrionota bacterium]